MKVSRRQILEKDRVKKEEMKQRVTMEYCQRIRKMLNSKLMQYIKAESNVAIGSVRRQT